MTNKKRIVGPGLRHLWMGLPFFLLLLKGFLFPLPLLDFWWHLKMGQVILETGAIPRIDSFSFTAAGKVFIVQNWLAEIVFHLVHRAGGCALLVFMNALLLALCLIPVFSLCRMAAGALWAGILPTCLVALCLSANLRPQVFSYLFFAAFYFVLELYRSNRKDAVWVLPFLTVLWVNLHGAFVLGLALITLVLICESARRPLRPSDPDTLDKKRIAKLAFVLGLCLVATLINPEKLGVYDYIRTVMNDPSSQLLVAEWQPPAISKVQGAVQFYIPFFLTTLVLIISKRIPSFTQAVLFAAFAILGMTATRNAAWFLFIAAPILATNLPFAAWEIVFPWRAHGRKPDSISPSPAARNMYESRPANLAIAVLAVVVLIYQSPWMQQRSNPQSLLDPQTPAGAMDFIRMHLLTGNIFHPQIYGDYLIWTLWPKQRSFFDGRVHLFGEPFVRTYQQIYRDSHGEELLKKYNIRFLLLSKSEEKPDASRFLDRVRQSSKWKLLYEDKVSVLLEDVSALKTARHGSAGTQRAPLSPVSDE